MCRRRISEGLSRKPGTPTLRVRVMTIIEKARKPAHRILRGSDGDEEVPVGFPGV